MLGDIMVTETADTGNTSLTRGRGTTVITVEDTGMDEMGMMATQRNKDMAGMKSEIMTNLTIKVTGYGYS